MITLNTLNSLIDDILLTIRNSNISSSESINRLQVEQWVSYYRAQILKEDLEKNLYIDPAYIQYLTNVHLQPVNINNIDPNVLGVCELVTEINIPKTIATSRSNGILSVTDIYGNEIQLTTKVRLPRQKYRKYTYNDYLAVYRDGKIYIQGPNELEYVNIAFLPEDPSTLGDCDFADKPYPIPTNKISLLKQFIFKNELGIMLQMPSDKVNNSNNDLENINIQNG